jgi:hypothetical protein
VDQHPPLARRHAALSLAEHLQPTKQRLDGEVADLRKVRDGADTKAARAAEKRLTQVSAARDELAEFIADLKACAEQGPPQPDPKTRARDDDAVYDPDLDDGVMINAAALWPLLAPQWKDPKKWWTELATGEGRKDYDWSHLAARYFKDRVTQKCKDDPSLAVAHGCFWKYHPERAYAWELRLQDEIAAGLHDRRGRLRRGPQALPGRPLPGRAGDPAKRAGPPPSQAREGRHRGAAGHAGRRGERR